MAQFKQGDAVRTKGGGPNLTVDRYAASGEVICTYWLNGVRKQDSFIEATLELIPSDQINPKPKASLTWLGKTR